MCIVVCAKNKVLDSDLSKQCKQLQELNAELQKQLDGAKQVDGAQFANQLSEMRTRYDAELDGLENEVKQLKALVESLTQKEAELGAALAAKELCITQRRTEVVAKLDELRVLMLKE
jgi:archaellum component FlaC